MSSEVGIIEKGNTNVPGHKKCTAQIKNSSDRLEQEQTSEKECIYKGHKHKQPVPIKLYGFICFEKNCGGDNSNAHHRPLSTLSAASTQQHNEYNICWKYLCLYVFPF